MILPERLPHGDKAILLGNDYLAHSLPWILLFVPGCASIFDGLVLKVLQKLNLEAVFGLMFPVEVLEPITQNMIRM